MTSHPDPTGPSVRRRSWLWSGLMIVALIIGVATSLLVLGALLAPGSSRLALLGSVVWPLAGPHLVLISLLAFLLAVPGLRRRPRSLAIVATTASAVALAGSMVLTGEIVRAIHDANGSVNLFRALWLSSMSAAEPDATETYATIDGQNLKASIFQSTQHSSEAPVLVYIHGGGFMAGTRLETAADLRWFADRGWLVISVDYRLFSDEQPTWDKAPRDVACALVWVHQNAERFGGNPGRLAVLGDSAGGNLAINLAYAAARDEAPSDCDDAVAVPQAVVVQYPAVDPIALYEYGYPVPGFEPRMLTTGYLGGRPDEVPDRVRAVSSATYLSENAPATLIIEPASDILVPSVSVYAFTEQARAAGVEIELIRIPHANHIYNQMAANSLGNQARLTITKRYLIEQGLGPNDASTP
jgi:acetyl esterase